MAAGVLTLCEPLDGELADGLEHPEPTVLPCEEVPVGERDQRLAVAVAHRSCRFVRAAAREDAETVEEALLGFAEQRVAPLDRRAQRLLARRHVTGPARGELESAGQHRAQLRHGHLTRSRSSELDRERQAVEAPTDLANVLGRMERAPTGTRALEKQWHRLLVEGQGRDVELVLAVDPEWTAARHEELEIRRVAQ